VSDTQPAGLQVRLRQQASIPLDAELACAPGELLALIGPSGSGKTTILRAIAGLRRPTLGAIGCDGETWFDSESGEWLSPQRRRVGMVFQDYALFPHLSALHNVSEALGHLPGGQRRARAQELLTMVHLSGLETRRPAHLSGGQRQRVALARALAREPRVLLLDEPFSAVDQVTRRKLQRELAILRRTIRVPILLVTHDLAEATALADRLCVLHRGVTLQTGAPDRVLARPASPLVARLMDQSNIFEGVVERVASGEQRGRLAWRRRTLAVQTTGGLLPGSKVSWMIPPSYIVLHRKGRPSLGDRENPVGGTVGDVVVLGESTSVTLFIEGDEGCQLNFTVSTHAARRNDIAMGTDAAVSLLADGIHVMPAEAGPGEGAA